MPTSGSEPRPATGEALLRGSHLAIGYGKLSVIEDVSLTINTGEVVALLGPNGAGKTTLLRGLSGLIAKSKGELTFAGQDITRATPEKTVRAGLVHVIEGHRVFGTLSVDDNLLLAAHSIAKAERGARIEEAYQTFPELAGKRGDKAGSLSGGQQQMLAIAQGLVHRPLLLMLDEPSGGLAPVLVDRILDVVRALRARGVSVLLVEQLVEKALKVADRALVITRGRVVLEGPVASLATKDVLERAYLGEGAARRG